MNPAEFTDRSPGRLVPFTITEYDLRSGRLVDKESWSFVPDPLPLALRVGDHVEEHLEHAVHALGRLDGLGRQLSNPYLLIRPFLRREAVASSSIEGTVTNLEQLFLFEEGGVPESPRADAQEVLNYVHALEYGLNRQPDRPITSLLIRELHERLMEGVEGGDKNPGRFRRGPVYIGRGTGIEKARFVPPPSPDVPELMLHLERAMAEPPRARLVRIALIHYQFETIHPFSDGNGRTGRLLIPLLMQEWRLLSQPLLYLSGYFEREKQAYVDGLLRVSQEGDWDGWVTLFAIAVAAQSTDAANRGQRLLDLRETYRHRYQGEPPARAVDVIDALFSAPVQSIPGLARRLGLEAKTVRRAVARLEEDGLLTEMTGNQRNRVYMAQEIIGILSTE